MLWAATKERARLPYEAYHVGFSGRVTRCGFGRSSWCSGSSALITQMVKQRGSTCRCGRKRIREGEKLSPEASLRVSGSDAAWGGNAVIAQIVRQLFVTAAAIAILGTGPAGAQNPPQRSVFLIEVWEQVQGGRNTIWRAISHGTAFFISADGTALTASHVVYRASKDRRYPLLAIVGREFYGASLVCASELPYDPTDQRPHRLVRDVAELHVTRPEVPFDSITFNGVTYATAHHGPFPAFPALSFGPDPQVGDRVRALGFGAVAQPLPYEWSAAGEVSQVGQLADGTPGFRMRFSAKPAVPGHSGSPVLNATEQVVGLLNWRDDKDVQLGTAISGSALQPACL